MKKRRFICSFMAFVLLMSISANALALSGGSFHWEFNITDKVRSRSSSDMLDFDTEWKSFSQYCDWATRSYETRLTTSGGTSLSSKMTMNQAQTKFFSFAGYGVDNYSKVYATFYCITGSPRTEGGGTQSHECYTIYD